MRARQDALESESVDSASVDETPENVDKETSEDDPNAGSG